MRDSSDQARLIRSRPACLLAVAMVLGVVSVAAACSGSPAAARGAAGQAPEPAKAGVRQLGSVSGCVLLPASCYVPHVFRVAYGIQPLLDGGIDGRGETVTVMAPAVSSNAPAVSSNAPAVSSNAPAVSSNAPAVSSNAPAVSSNAPLSGPAGTDIRQDLAAFDRMFGLPAARIQVVTALAGAASPWLASGEEIQDFEIVHTAAPAATLRVVLLPSNALNSAATATRDMIAALRLPVAGTDVASISFSSGEHYFSTAQVAQMHEILLGAAAHDVTVVASSGVAGASSVPR